MSSSPFEIMKLGGPIMWVLLLGSILAVAVFVERVILFHRSSVNVDRFLKGIGNLLRLGRFEEALERCDESYGPAVRVVQAAIIKRKLPKHELREIVQEVAQLQMPRLEANIPLLSTVGYISPLLGLLGTVIGMIKAFQELNKAMGASPINDLAAGIWEALVTTAFGLVVAIPAYVAYNYLASKLNQLVTDMERCGIEIIQILSEPSDHEVLSRSRSAGQAEKEASQAVAPAAKKEADRKDLPLKAPEGNVTAVPSKKDTVKISLPELSPPSDTSKEQALPAKPVATEGGGFWSKKST
jgi:biopolymer transport protein ExbB